MKAPTPHSQRTVEFVWLLLYFCTSYLGFTCGIVLGACTAALLLLSPWSFDVYFRNVIDFVGPFYVVWMLVPSLLTSTLSSLVCLYVGRKRSVVIVAFIVSVICAALLSGLLYLVSFGA